MDKAEITSYSVIDLLSWQESGALRVSPKFQRRGVWGTAAKGHLIDSILLGYSIPPIHIRLAEDAGGRIVREVIDGQQRVRAVFDFIAGKYRIPPSVSRNWGGHGFDELDNESRELLKLFSFVVYQYKRLNDADVLDMFSRLNMYSVSLNAQELRNGKWFGEFKRLSYGLATESLEFWRQKRIISESQIARMREAELVSELLVLQLDGLQDKKKSLDVFYDRLDEEWGINPIQWEAGRTASVRPQPVHYLSADESGTRYRQTMIAIDRAIGDVLAEGPLRRPALFYTLFGAAHHVLYGLPRGESLPLAQAGFDNRMNRAFQRAAVEVADVFANDGKTRNANLSQFFGASGQQTDNIEPRQARLGALLQLVSDSL
ncbi:DUF262 domain-containing protein [Microbacterium sp. No. 7]|uniref:DUF262 domain-containing protein n=1 Tax=Microbacterium sp. No. 7 TaxID=1714373 RepID=UPI00300AFCDF